MRNAFSLLVGLVFGLGLCVSGMNEPSKVLGFLDLAGNWDPSLAFVMAGAIAVAAPAFALARRRREAWFGAPIDLPRERHIDVPLALGAVVFGAGWGLGGLCPGPAIVNLGFLAPSVLVFVAAMVAGTLLGSTAFSAGLNRAAQIYRALAASRPNDAESIAREREESVFQPPKH